MILFRLFLATCLVAIVGYTSVTISTHGWGLMLIFVGDMAEMAWPGQFNLDFFTMLLLSGLWAGWRNRFSAAGLILSIASILGGMLFLSIFLLFLTYRHGGDMRAVLLGTDRALT